MFTKQGLTKNTLAKVARIYRCLLLVEICYFCIDVVCHIFLCGNWAFSEKNCIESGRLAGGWCI
jgi:hypothetical protein